MRRRGVHLLAAGVVVSLVGLAVFVLATELFPHHSVNDDEGVYLTQAAMLLEGRLFLRPATDLAAAVRPWFFVVDGAGADVRMYPKYAPVPAAIFAVGTALGEPRLSLGLVALGTAALVYWLAREAFDPTAGVVAALALGLSPLFVLTSATFLPYAPTTLCSLAFACAYVRAARAPGHRRLPWAVVAGAAVGVAFFSRPYTAILFAAPFVVHALWSIARDWSTDRRRATLARSVAVAGPGLAGVGVALAYNAVVTGDPFVFPYEAFAPRDGLGFGHRELLGYDVEYTPALGVASTVDALTMLVRAWAPVGPLGVAVALAGAAFGLAGRYRGGRWHRTRTGRARASARRALPDRELRLVVAGIAPSVVLGNVYFWGTLNGLRNGLFDLLGPYYHFDLLVPLSVFAGAGAVALARRFHALARRRLGPSEARGLVLVALVVTAPVVGVATAGVFDDPVRENAARTAVLADTYDPLEREFDRALVFTPDPYGDWQAHPFQALRNDPGFDGSVVYATEGPPGRDLRVATATNRTPYRFTYRGAWTGATDPVDPALTRLRVVSGESIRATTTVGVPAQARSVSVRVETDEGYARYAADASGETLTVDWRLGDEARAVGRERVAGSGTDGAPVPAGASQVVLLVTFVGDAGASVTYRQAVSVERREGRVRALWPPVTRVCRLTTDCGREGTWVGPSGEYVDGVAVEETTARAENGTVA